jgi:hypothetical protein
MFYVQALRANRTGQASEQFDHLLYQRLDAALDETLAAANDAIPHAVTGMPSKPGD